jgi:hypothetical protein
MFIRMKLALLAGGVITAALFTGLFKLAPAHADTAQPWLGASILNLQQQAISSPPTSINGNIDCYPLSGSICMVNTGYGLADTASELSIDGNTEFYQVRSNLEDRPRYIPIPNSTTAITYTSEPVYGLYLYFNFNFQNALGLVHDNTSDYLHVKKPPDGTLADSTGKKLAADYESISFSENSEWMVVSEPNVAMLRVNLRTFEVKPFATGFDYSIGAGPSPKTAITNDGRYAVVASKSFNRFNIYDLNSCSAGLCQARDLQSFMRGQLNGYTAVNNLRFVTDDTLSLYAGNNDGSGTKTSKYILSNTQGGLHRQDMLALGDSYISGEGEFDYLPGTDTGQNTCHVSPLSYPLQMGYELNFNSYHSVACSGATTNDLIDVTSDYAGQALPHTKRSDLDQKQVSLVINNFQPGYIDQLDFVKQYQPQNITLSIGGNDIGFSSILQSCINLGTCYDTYEDRVELVSSIHQQFNKLVSTYAKLRQSGTPDSRIYVMAYPQIAKPDGDCALNVHLNGDELVFASQLIDYLDSVIKSAAAKAGVYYVDNENALNGFRLCEAGPGGVAVNGLTAGNDFPEKLNGPIGRESYHPNVFGHQVLDNSVLKLTHNLTNPMPAADVSATPPGYVGLPILNMPHSGRALRTTEFDQGLGPDLAYQAVPISISLSGASHGLSSGSILQAELHSTPTNLGSFTTDANGDLSANITIPASVPTGYHSLHFYGSDITGQPVDIFKTIYVAATADDLDGNGVTDSTQACVGITASDQDADKDGIDDACDANINLPPAPTNRAGEASGAVASQTSGLIVASQPVTSNDKLASSNQSITSQPAVLGAHTISSSQKPKTSAAADIRLPTSYFAASGLGLFILSSLGYLVKLKLL